MISKVITGKTFYGTCRYICMDQKRALILETEGVRRHNYKLMAADFDMQRELRPTLGIAVFHGFVFNDIFFCFGKSQAGNCSAYLCSRTSSFMPCLSFFTYHICFSFFCDQRDVKAGEKSLCNT